MKTEEPIMAYGLPLSMNPASLIGFIPTFEKEQQYLKQLKQIAQTTDDRIAYWLNMNVQDL